jgi:hypothetical protein
LGFIELYTRISYEFETNEVFLNFALPKPKWGIHIRIKAPLDVLRIDYFPTSTYSLEELQQYATVGLVGRRARPRRTVFSSPLIPYTPFAPILTHVRGPMPATPHLVASSMRLKTSRHPRAGTPPLRKSLSPPFPPSSPYSWLPRST